jgi:hypothetical protein
LKVFSGLSGPLDLKAPFAVATVLPGTESVAECLLRSFFADL